jgi:transposase
MRATYTRTQGVRHLFAALELGRNKMYGHIKKREWAEANNVEIAYTPTNSSWLNRIEAQFTALREFTLNGTDHGGHREKGSMIRRCIAWRNRNTDNPRIRKIVQRANVA